MHINYLYLAFQKTVINFYINDIASENYQPLIQIKTVYHEKLFMS